MLDNTPNQISKVKTKNWAEVNVHHIIPTVKLTLKLPMLKTNLCNYKDVYIVNNGTITITGVKGAGDAAVRQTDKRNKELIFKNRALFTECISMINNTQK